MRVLITGGAGFIGSHLAEACLAKGDEVYIIDDLSTGSLENIKHLQNNPDFEGKLFVHVDTIFNNELLMEHAGICDRVYHLAAAVGVRYILDNPMESMHTNIHGTETVLEMCSKFKKRVLIASSSEVYGKHTHAPLIETDNIIYGPSSKFRWSYAASKLIDEFAATAHHRTSGLEVMTTRLFNTVGPRQTGTYGMVIPRFVTQALKNEQISVYGDGTQTRTFTFVKDVVSALMMLMDVDGNFGEVFNIGGIEEISMFDLATKIKNMANSTSEIKLIPYDVAFEKDFEDMQRRVPSIEKIKSLTGYEPTTGLDEILEKVIDFQKTEGRT